GSAWRRGGARRLARCTRPGPTLCSGACSTIPVWHRRPPGAAHRPPHTPGGACGPRSPAGLAGPPSGPQASLMTDIGPTGGNVRPAAISSNALFDNMLVAHCTVDDRSAEFPKTTSTGNFVPDLPPKSASSGHLGGKVPVQNCKTAHGTSL